jgi:zinc protease
MRSLRRGLLAITVLGGALSFAACQRASGPAHGDSPGKADAAALEPPDEPFRAMPAPVGTPRPFVPPTVLRFMLPTGVDVILVERHTLPIVTWQAVFPGGYLSDPPGKEGRADLCTGLIVQGGQEDTADLLADYGSSIHIASSLDEMSLQGFSLGRNLDSTLELWAHILTMPGMEAADLDRQRASRVTGILQARANPSALASRLLALASFGPGHPIARAETEASLNAITVDDCLQFRADFLHGNGARLLIAGDITRAEVEAKFTAKLMDAQPAKQPPALPMSMPDATRILFSDVPGTTQSQVVMWAPGPRRQAPEYFASTVMAAIFAGDSTLSRLGADLREMMGTTYSVGGGFSFTKVEGTLIVSTPVRTDATATAVGEMLKVAASMRDVVASEDELARTRDGRISALPARFATIAGTLGAFADLAYYDLPFTFFQDFGRSFGAVNAAAVQAAARTILAPDRLRFIVVGDGRIVLGPLRALTAAGGLLEGSVLHVVDADGKVTSGM